MLSCSSNEGKWIEKTLDNETLVSDCGQKLILIYIEKEFGESPLIPVELPLRLGEDAPRLLVLALIYFSAQRKTNR